MIRTYTPNAGQRDSNEKLLWGVVVQTSVLSTACTVGIAASALPTSPLSNRRTMTVFNNSEAIIYLGDSAVTVASGFPLYPKASMTVALEDGVSLYGISAVAGCDVRVLEGA